jgi:hypothetical protein
VQRLPSRLTLWGSSATMAAAYSSGQGPLPRYRSRLVIAAWIYCNKPMQKLENVHARAARRKPARGSHRADHAAPCVIGADPTHRAPEPTGGVSACTCPNARLFRRVRACPVRKGGAIVTRRSN